MPRRKPPVGSATALAALRQALSQGVAGRDGRLPQLKDLVAQLGLDQRSARRALEVLESEGAVWRGAGGALFAAPAGSLDESDSGVSAALQEARLMLEPKLAALAARRGGARDVARLRGLAARAAAAGDSDGLGLWDAAFHRAIAMAAGNAWLLRAYMALDCRRATFVPEALAARRTAAEIAWSDAAVAEHRALIDAVAAGDAEAADAAMRAHIVAAKTRADAALRRPAPGAAQA